MTFPFPHPELEQAVVFETTWPAPVLAWKLRRLSNVRGFKSHPGQGFSLSLCGEPSY